MPLLAGYTEKIFAKTATDEGNSVSDKIFAFTNAFVIEASETLSPFVIKCAINNIKTIKEAETFQVSETMKATAVNGTLPIMHPECILEWVEALDLEIS